MPVDQRTDPLDALDIYLQELGQGPLLTFNEEQALGQTITIGKLAVERLNSQGLLTGKKKTASKRNRGR